MAENIYLFGVLKHPILLEIVAGSLPVTEPAVFEGARIVRTGGRNRPTLIQTPGEAVEGLLLRALDPVTRDRIAHYADAFGFELRDCTVSDIRGTPVAARVFMPSLPGQISPAGWKQDEWAGSADARADCFAAVEIMGLWGRFSGPELQFRVNQIEARAWSRVRAEAQPVERQVGTGPSSPRVEVLSQQDYHAGYFFTRTFDLTHATFAGSMSHPIRREVFLSPDAAILLPYDPVRDRVLMVEQFRMGPFARGERLPWTLEAVAGRVDPGEDPETCARREGVEEAGLSLREMHHITSCYPSPGCQSEYIHCYLGICDLPDMTSGSFGLEEEAEDIRTHVLPYELAMELVSSGEAHNAPLILSMLWLQGKRSELRGAA